MWYCGFFVLSFVFFSFLFFISSLFSSSAFNIFAGSTLRIPDRVAHCYIKVSQLHIFIMTPFFFTCSFTHDKRHVHTYIYTHIYTLIHIVIHTHSGTSFLSRSLLLILLSFFPSLLYCLYSRVALTLKSLWQRFFNALPSNLARLIRYVTRQLFFSSSLLHPLFLIFTTYFRQSRPTELNARARATHTTHALFTFYF